MIKMIQVMKKKVPNHDIYLCGLDEANDEVINRHHLYHDENVKEAQNHDNFLVARMMLTYRTHDQSPDHMGFTAQ